MRRPCRGWRVKPVVQAAFVSLTLLTMVVMIPPLRNVVIPSWPGPWRPLSTMLVITTKLVTLSDDGLAFLSPCDEPFSTLHGLRLPEVTFAKGLSENDWLSHERSRLLLTYNWLNRSFENYDKYSVFLPQMTVEEKLGIIKMWRTVHDVFSRNNITYFLSDGSLLGVIRHAGIIPWDDDIDIAVSVSAAGQVRRVLSCLPGYTLRVQDSMHWKFFQNTGRRMWSSNSSSTISERQNLPANSENGTVVRKHKSENVITRFPFIDIFFTDTDGVYTWAVCSYILISIFYLNTDIFPLITMEFEGFPAPVPRLVYSIGSAIFGDNCVSPSLNHMTGIARNKVLTIPCEELKGMYPGIKL